MSRAIRRQLEPKAHDQYPPSERVPHRIDAALDAVAQHQSPREAQNVGARNAFGGAAQWDVIEQALGLPLPQARQMVLEEFERRYVARLLERHYGNVTRAAQTAGVARRYFQILKARATRQRASP